MIGRLVDEQGRLPPPSSPSTSSPTTCPSGLPRLPTATVPEFGQTRRPDLRRRAPSIASDACASPSSAAPAPAARSIEQLARNCVGELVLVDPDRVEEKNLNRILNATMDDARQGRASRSRSPPAPSEPWASGPWSRPIHCNLFDLRHRPRGRGLRRSSSAAWTRSTAAICSTSWRRSICSRTSTSASSLRPTGAAASTRCAPPSTTSSPAAPVCSAGTSTRWNRSAAAGLYRTDPSAYRDLLDDGYIRGVQEDRPAVVQLNSLHRKPRRQRVPGPRAPVPPGSQCGLRRPSPQSQPRHLRVRRRRNAPCPVLARHVGRGDVSPLLGLGGTQRRQGGGLNATRRTYGGTSSSVPASAAGFATELVDDLPDVLAPARLYLIGDPPRPWSAAMLCPCGCAATIQLSLVAQRHAKLAGPAAISTGP